MKPDLIRGHLDGLVLAVLAAGAAHGYGIIQTLRERSGGEFDLTEGSIYPALHRLERTGLVRSDWSQAGGRPRRVYRITARGEAALEAERAQWRRFAAATEGILLRRQAGADG
jgi:DNA-binding PadR family transcriptional regulator